jgi:PTH1 family peptidyl-tRNA hydrolase
MNTTVLIVGLGNPGPEYRDTRHNAGAMLADEVARRLGSVWAKEARFFAECATGWHGARRVLLSKPATYMNASGESVGPLARYHRLDPPAVMILADDADLPLGTVRLKPSGGAGGHHGIESVARHLGSRDFPRLKLGIARPEQPRRDIASHVLGRFSAEEREQMDVAIRRGADQIECWLTDGLQKAMNLYNGAA